MMTIQDAFHRLYPIETAVTGLIRDTGFYPDDGLGSKVAPLPDACENAFLRDRLEGILDTLLDVGDELRYLRKPTHGEHTLMKFPSGRYGYPSEDGAVREFTCGDCLEAKIQDRSGSCRWIISRLEHDGFDYFLVGSRGTPPDGLTVRERW